VKFVSRVSYLGVHLNSNLCDDDDIALQVRCLYVAATNLKLVLAEALLQVKNVLFRSYCMCFYPSQLWHNVTLTTINRLRVAYNDACRILHGLPRFCMACHVILALEKSKYIM